MKLFIEKFVEDLSEHNLLSRLNSLRTQLDDVSIKECLQYTSYGFFIGAIISLFQGDITHVIISLLIAIFLKL